MNSFVIAWRALDQAYTSFRSCWPWWVIISLLSSRAWASVEKVIASRLTKASRVYVAEPKLCDGAGRKQS